MKNILAVVLTLFVIGRSPLPVYAQTAKSIIGTVTTFKPQTMEMEIKPDNASPIPVKLLANTAVQRIPPGETSLKNAVTIKAADVSIGDRVLVSLGPNNTDAIRIVVMSANDIAKRDDADREDWNKRGVSGIVSAKSGSQITLKQKTPQGEVQETVTISDKTKFLRYAADSVKFSDAKPSKIEDIAVGDQLRARGDKSADGLKVTAEDVVFGTFLTKAGSVVSIDAAAKEVTVKELGTAKSFVVKFTSDSTIKLMSPTAAIDPRGSANMAQMIDTLPAGKIEDIKTGASIVVSGSRGAKDDEVVAIVFLANADALIKTAAQSGKGGSITFGTAGSGGIDILGIGQ